MNINRDGYEELKKLYKHAVEHKLDKFTFKGEELLVGYAKYLIEYLKLYYN